MNSTPVDLNPERWARVERLFDDVADMSASERASYLAKACGDDSELRAYVESLARSDVAADTIIEDSIRGVLELAMPGSRSLNDAIGERIGPYRIVRVIGSGGMGVVYLAERADEQFTQHVAIKLVRQRLIDPEIVERLVSERQILANLDHPNIARLFDGGTTADGTPYLVMEYIDGLPIDDYCDSHRLTINERLNLFRTICSAVHYAHQNLIVHRDIKPTNILVTGDSTPKLLDFGIAKLLDAGGAATEGLTREGVLMMTPENAAPEQVLNKAITTATDTYALGILLYRLLCGHPPYRIRSSVPNDMAQIICHQHPERPSVRVARPAEPVEETSAEGVERVTPELVSRYRSTAPEKLKRRLKGDLDNIVLIALRKEPERRYRSVHELSEDIRLHLASQPVRAQPDTWSYRAGKFVHRHAAGVAMSSLLVALLIAFAVAMTIQTQRIARERDTAKEVSNFLEQIFMAPDPGNARGVDITAKELLARGADRITEQLGERPVIQATMMDTIGRVYFNLGEYDPSISMLEEALRIREKTLGEGHQDIAAAKNDLAASLIKKAEYDRARALLQEALQQNRRQAGASSAAVAANLHNLAEVYQATGDLHEAERLANESIAIYVSNGDPFTEEIAEGKSTLARILVGKNELDAAEALYREAIALVKAKLGNDHPFIAYYLQNLAVLLQTKGDVDAAEVMFRESIQAARNVFGEKHSLLGGSLVRLGTLLHNKGQFDAAETALRDALKLHREARGPDHPFVAYDMTALAMLLCDKAELEEAESLLRDALRLLENSVGTDHQYVASTLTELGAVLTEKGAPDEAAPLLQRAIAIRTADYALDNPLVAATNTVYAHTLAGLGRYQEAERLLLDNYPNLAENDGPMDRRTRRALGWTVSLYEAWNKPEQADRYRQLLSSGAPPQRADP
jgi:serine/threonine-protein kinase